MAVPLPPIGLMTPSAVVYWFPLYAQSLTNCTGARFAPPRTSFWKFELASHRHAKAKRLGSEFV